MEPIYRQSFTLHDDAVDCFGYLKLSTLLYYAQEVAGQHCQLLGTDGDTLATHDLFWAVTRHKVLIHRLPRLHETITVETWPMPTTKVAYPRAMAAYDENGALLFQSVSLWVLMDTKKRAMVLPGKSGILVEGTVRGNELQLPHSLLPKTLTNTQNRTVTYSHLDRNGHMNNTRYLDWVADLPGSSFHRAHKAKEILISYANEARENQLITLDWALQEGNLLQVDAHSLQGENPQRVFCAQVLFD